MAQVAAANHYCTSEGNKRKRLTVRSLCLPYWYWAPIGPQYIPLAFLYLSMGSGPIQFLGLSLRLTLIATIVVILHLLGWTYSDLVAEQDKLWIVLSLSLFMSLLGSLRHACASSTPTNLVVRAERRV